VFPESVIDYYFISIYYARQMVIRVSLRKQVVRLPINDEVDLYGANIKGTETKGGETKYQ
jgi:hypothetical protein